MKWLLLGYVLFAPVLVYGIAWVSDRIDVHHEPLRLSLRGIRPSAILVSEDELTLDEDIGGLA